MRSRQSLVLVLCAAFGLAFAAPVVSAQAVDQEAPQSAKPAAQAPKPAGAPPAVAAKPATTLPAEAAPTAAPVPLPQPADWSANIRVDVTITDASRGGPTNQKSISVTVRQEGRGSVRSGVSLPIPSTTFTPIAQGGAATNPMTSWQYKDMGLSLDVTSATIVGNFIKLRLAVEYNPVDEKTANVEGANALPTGQSMASFAQFRQNLDIVLENGKPLVVATSSDPVPSRERKASLEVKATVLR